MTEVEKAGDNSSMVSSLYHFPLLYEGDCFYDILARFSEESGYLKSNDVSKELFGTHPDLRCYRRNKNGQITGPENEHLTPSRGLTSASERRKPLFLRLPGVFLR